MLALDELPELRDSGGNSSFGDMVPGTISSRAVGRFRSVLDPTDITFIQLMARRGMKTLDYGRERARLGPAGAARFAMWDLPVNGARMLGWMVIAQMHERRGAGVPQFRLAEAPEEASHGQQ
jgi:hypothetical protein